MAGDQLRLAYIADPNSVHTQRWLRWFAEHGHDVHLLEGFGTEIRAGLDPRVTVHSYRAHGGSRIPGIALLRGRAALRSVLDRIDPDVLHGHFIRRYGWQVALSGRHPYVLTAWGSDVLLARLRTWRVRWRDRRALGGADLVTVVSDYMRDATIRAGARPGRIVQVQFGVDSNRFRPGPADPELAARLDLQGRPFVFSPRAVRPLYRHETVVDAMVGLGDDVLLVMSGRGADDGYLAELRRRMEANGLGDRLRVIDDIPDDDLPALYRMASVVVSVPESDSFALTILEAMASGTPVVAGDLPPVRAELGTVAPDALVPVGDADRLRDAVRSVLALGSERRRELGERLRAYAVEHADYEENMARMESLYRELARRRGGPG